MSNQEQLKSNSLTSPPPMGSTATLMLFGAAALLLFVVTHIVIPALAETTSAEPVLLWFLAGGLGVFTPLIAIAIVMLKREGTFDLPGIWQDRLRFRCMNAVDWIWGMIGIIVVGVLGATALIGLQLFYGQVELSPPFLTMEPLRPGRYWILAVWVPFWLLNILSEEVLWRGVVLPRQESAFGKWGWIANGSGWLLFHVAFGTTILLTLWPMLFILPYLAQRRHNSWVGVLIHAGINGPGFLAVAFGLA